MGRYLTEKEKIEIIELYKQGKTGVEIAEMYNKSFSCIYRLLERANINKRERTCTKITNDIYNRIEHLYIQDKLTTEEVAKAINSEFNVRISIGAIQYRLRKNNLTRQNGKTLFEFNHDYFEDIDTERKAYWLGFLYADGSIVETKKKNHIKSMLSIEIKKTDAYLLEELKKDLNSDLEIKFLKKQSFINKGYDTISETCYIRFHSKKLISDLKKWGCIPNKTGKLNEIPDIKDDLIRHFIRGYFDGNGTCGQVKDSPNCFNVGFCGSYDFVCNINKRIKREGFITETNVYKRGKYDSVLSYTTLQVYDFFNKYFYDDASIFLHRKKDRFIEFNNKLTSR